MKERAMIINTPDGQTDAWFYTPKSTGSWAGIILHTDIRGIRETFKKHAAKLASYGFAVLLPNVYYRVSKAPVAPPDLTFQMEEGRKRFTELKNTLSQEKLKQDHGIWLNWLQQRPEVKKGPVGIVGYCFSGAIALHAAADFADKIAAVASFHGGGLFTEAPDSPHLRLPEIKAKLHFGHAKEDASMPSDAIEKLNQALKAVNTRFTVTQHDAKHGFAVPDSPAYNAEAAQQHWDDLLKLLKSTL